MTNIHLTYINHYSISGLLHVDKIKKKKHINHTNKDTFSEINLTANMTLKAVEFDFYDL